MPESFASEGEAQAFIADLDRITAQAAAKRLAAITAAGRSGVAAGRGRNGTQAWLAGASRQGSREAARDVKLASALDEGLPATGAALSEGEVTQGHVEVIAKAMTGLPDSLTPGEVEIVEEHLVERAKVVDPGTLRREARRVLEQTTASTREVDAHHDQVVRDEEAAALEKVKLTYFDNRDGTMNIHATVTTFAGQVLIGLLQQMTSPRTLSNRDARERQADSDVSRDAKVVEVTEGGDDARGDGECGSANGAGVAADDLTLDTGDGDATEPTSGCDAAEADVAAGVEPKSPRDWARERGLAFTQVLEHLPTDELPAANGATVLVTMREEDLTAALDLVDGGCVDGEPSPGEELLTPNRTARPATCETGHEISAGEARRAACNAGLVPVVLGGESQPLDVGRAKRLFTEPQRRALATKYVSCAADGCDRPFSWAELHHLTPWKHGGPTDLTNALPLCWEDHRRIHNPQYVHERVREPDGTLTIRFHLRQDQPRRRP